MNSLEGIIAANRAADRQHAEANKRSRKALKAPAAKPAPLKPRVEPARDSSGRLVR